MRNSGYSSSRSDTHTQDDLTCLIHSHTYSHTRSLNFTHLKSSADPFQLVSKQMDSKFISFSHTYSVTHTHTVELRDLPHFLVLPFSHKVRRKPSFAEISFYVSVYTLCKAQSCSIVFTSFPAWRSHFLLHCVTLPWGTFLKLCEICAACVCAHAGMRLIMQEKILHMLTIFVCACEFVHNAPNMNCI